MALSDAQVCGRGGGIAGALTACLRDDAGRDVVIIDKTGAAMHVAPSTRILGKFGDIVPYGNRDLYFAHRGGSR